MGIRYYAYPVTRAQLEAAALSPESVIPPDPFATSFIPRIGGAPGAESTDDLYLDKVWSWVGHLFETDRGAPGRPALELFKGDATIDGAGCIPWEQVVGPDDLAPIAEDLAAAGPADVDALIRSGRYHFTPAHGTEILQLLEDTQAFVGRRVERDEGMVIYIG